MPTTPSRPGPGRRPVQAVTTARLSVEEDRHRRMRNYLVAMGFRIIGFPVSVWLLLNDFLVPGIILAACATVVPSIAVVVANAVDRRGTSTQDATPVSPVQGLGPARTADDRGDDEHREARVAGPDEPITGTVVSSRATPYPHRPGPAGTPKGDEGRPRDDRESA